MATVLLTYSKYKFGVQLCLPNGKIYSVQLMADIAMSHNCVVGGLQHGCLLLLSEHTVH